MTTIELGRGLTSLTAALAEMWGTTEADAAGALKEALSRGGRRLIQELEDLTVATSQTKDAEILSARRQAYQAVRLAVRYSAPALLGQLAEDSVPASAAEVAREPMRKEAQDFLEVAARLVPDEMKELEDLTSAPVNTPAGASATSSASSAPADAALIRRLRERVVVLNEVLEAWGVGEPPMEDRSRLVAEGIMTVDAWRAAHRDLARRGAEAILTDLLASEEPAEEPDDPDLQVIRAAVTEGAAAHIPRVISRLVNRGLILGEAGDAWADHLHLIRDLQAYLRGAASMFGKGSPLRHRFLDLAVTMNTVAARYAGAEERPSETPDPGLNATIT